MFFTGMFSFAITKFIFCKILVGGKVGVCEAILVFIYQIGQDDHKGRTAQTI